MTYLEKFIRDHPGWNVEGIISFTRNVCPPSYGLDRNCPRNCTMHGLVRWACWNREIPETENNEREEKKMEATVTTRKTKAELLKDIADLKKELERMEHYKQYEECADEMAAMRESFDKAGFNREESFELVKLMFENAVKMAKR